MVPVKIVSVVFAEVADASMVVINKDETLADVELENGAVFELDSISKTLDSDVDIESQSLSVPGGVTMLLVGENSSGELVKIRLLWLYSTNCDLVHPAGRLGWIEVVRYKTSSFVSLIYLYLNFIIFY